MKEGLHQDLNAKATEEVNGPNFPCTKEKTHNQGKYNHLKLRHNASLTFNRKFLLACHDAANWNKEKSSMLDDFTSLILWDKA